MKKLLYVLFLAGMLLFLIAADVLPGTEVPIWAVAVLTTFLIPGVVGGAKWLSKQAPWLAWLNGKFWLSVLTYILAAVAVAIFINWKAIPALPEDPGLAVPLVVVYVQAFFGAATGLYNVLIDPVHTAVAK